MMPKSFDLKQSKCKKATQQIFDNKIELDGQAFDDDEWLTTEMAANFLRISSASLRNKTSNGTIPYQKLGRRNRYRKSDLVSLLLATRKGGINGN